MKGKLLVRGILGVVLAYYVVAFVVLLNAYLFPAKGESIVFVPIIVSVFLLFPIYVWYRNYRKKAGLSKETTVGNKGTVFLWVFTLFVLALSVRIPSVLLFGEPYEKTPLILLTILTILVVEKTEVSAFGFTTRKFAKSLVYGLLFFLLLDVLALALFYLLTYIFTNQMLFQSFDPVSFLLVMPFMTLCVGISEEGLFRGYMQTQLEKIYTAKKAIIFQAVLFGVWHFVWNLSPFNPSAMAQYVMTTFFIGLFLGYFYSKTRNLTAVVFAHGLWDSFACGIIENTAAENTLQTTPVLLINQVLMIVLPYAITALLTLLFIKYFVKFDDA